MKVQNVNWEVFSKQEADRLQQIINQNQKDMIACVCDDINKDKEAELQKISDQMNNISQNFVSTVREKYWLENPGGPQTQEEEAKLQAEIDKEFAEYKKRSEEQAKARMKNFEKQKDEKQNNNNNK